MTQISTLHMASGIGAQQRIAVPYGLSVQEIADRVHSGLEGLVAFVRAPAGHADEWIEIPRSMWRLIKPNVSDSILFGYRMGKSALKSVFSILAAVLVTVVGVVLGPLGFGLLGSTAASLVAAAVGVGAQLAINALFPPEPPDLSSRDRENQRRLSDVNSDSNLIAKEAYLAYSINRRILLPEIASPFFYLDNGLQAINRVFALDGQNLISDIEIDGNPISDFDAISVETRGGAEASPVSTFIDKIAHSDRVGETLSTFSLDESDLVDQETPSNSEPRWLRFTAKGHPKLEEISIRIQVDSFAKSDSADDKVIVPIRIRFREKGAMAGWSNIPEIHLRGRDISSSLKEIRFRWDADFGAADQAGDIQYRFYQQVPETPDTLSDGSTGVQWQADAHFVAGDGIRETQNISGFRNGLRITLDEAVYPKGEYEFEIKRGMAIKQKHLADDYRFGSNFRSLFHAYTDGATWIVPQDQGAFVPRISVAQVASIANEQPCQRPGTALVALKSLGQSMQRVTAYCTRYVHDWDGAGWNTLTTTKNPAVHYRQMLFDYLTHHGIDTDLIADDQFVAWRAECEAQGYEVSAVFAGAALKEALAAIAAAGYARPRISDGFGIDYFRDRSSERPVQSFSPRNATISVEWVATEKPVGIRAKFQNEENGFEDDEMQINNPFYSNFSGYQVTTYQTISKPSLIERRAYFDMLQAFYQGRRSWIVETALEGLICERGDLVAVVSDIVNDAGSGARIREVINPNTIRIDQDIPAEGTVSIFAETNIFDTDNIFAVGAQSVCLISTPTGTVMRSITAAYDDVIRLDESLPGVDVLGAHIVIGMTSEFTSRCVVSEVRRQGEERATLVLVDEAPEIYEAMQERFP